MFKIFLYQLRYEFYKVSLARKIGFIISLIIMGIVFYTDSLETDYSFVALCGPALLFTDDWSLDADAVRLLPMTDNQFKGFIVLKNLGNSLTASFLTALCVVPCIIRCKLSFIVFFRIMISVYFYIVVISGCKYKCKGKIYPGKAFNIVCLITFATTGVFMITDIRTCSVFTLVDFVVAVIAYAAALIVHYKILSSIPLGEISFDVNMEKRKGEPGA